MKHIGVLTKRESEIPPEDLQKMNDLAEELEQLFKPMNTTACAKCTHYEHYYNPGYRCHGQVRRGCCTGCANVHSTRSGTYRSGGYFFYGQIPSKRERIQFNRLVKLYWVDDQYGFFNPKTLSCNLPRARRSYTCLAFYCDEFTGSVAKKTKVVSTLNKLKEKHKLIL